MISLAAAEDMTQRNANPYFIRASATSAQAPHAIADYAAKEMKLKRTATIAEDFAFGYEQMGGFQRVFEDNGGKIVKKLWPPLGDAGQHALHRADRRVRCRVQRLRRLEPAQIHARNTPISASREDARRWAAGPPCDDALLKSFGDEAIGDDLGAPGTRPISTRRATSASSPTMRRITTSMPGGYSAGMYIAGQIVEAALQKIDGKTDNKEAFMEALRACR